MEPEEIVRRLETLRDRIREELAEAEPPRIGEDAADADPLELEEIELPPVTGEPTLNSTPHLEEANRRAAIGAPVEIRSSVPVVGPLLDLLRRMMRPLVQPFIDPYVDRQERFNAEVTRHLNELGRRLEVRLERVWDDLVARAADPRLLEARLEGALSDYDTALRQRHALLFDALEQELWALRELVADAPGGGDLERRLAEFEVRFVERAQAVDRRFDEKDEAMQGMFSEMASKVSRSRSVGLSEGEALETRTLLREALEVARASGSDREGETREPRFDSELQARLRAWMQDEDYRAFQREFRGDADEIRRRLEAHRELFREVPGPVADLGCGRGEFLDLLAAEGIDCIGVEVNDADVQECRARGLEATTADLFDWLQEREPDSLGGIFMAQVIEHIPPPDWSRFISLAATRIAPGGLLAVETINPESLYAMSRAYVLDPTHTRPVPPDLLAFLATRSGFDRVDIRFQAPVPDDARVPPIDERVVDESSRELVHEINRRLQGVNDLFSAPQEYLLVARRTGSERKDP